MVWDQGRSRRQTLWSGLHGVSVQAAGVWWCSGCTRCLWQRPQWPPLAPSPLSHFLIVAPDVRLRGRSVDNSISLGPRVQSKGNTWLYWSPERYGMCSQDELCSWSRLDWRLKSWILSFQSLDLDCLQCGGVCNAGVTVISRSRLQQWQLEHRLECWLSLLNYQSAVDCMRLKDGDRLDVMQLSQTSLL